MKLFNVVSKQIKTGAIITERKDCTEAEVAKLQENNAKWESTYAELTVTEVEATHANMIGYSEIYPYEIVRVISATTVEIRAMRHIKDPAWKPEISVGGFAGHCHNQGEQTWLYESDESAPVIRMRKVKPCNANRFSNWKSAYGFHRLATAPRYFYDYNF